MLNFKFDLKSEIGGCLCFTKGTPSTSQVFFEKNQYYLGEVAKVRVITDNTQCSKDIKNFKFKLVRRYEGDANIAHVCENVQDVVNLKFEGCKSGETVDKIFTL